MRVMIDNLRRRRSTSADGGFTLVELVISVAILGIISVALFGVVIEYLKVSTVTESRLSESTDQQFVSTYWQADVSSLGNRSLNAANASDPVPSAQSVWKNPSGGCGSSVSGGSVVVRFEWKEFTIGTDDTHAWSTTDQAAAYVTVADGSQFVLKRVRCRAGAVVGSPITIAHHLAAVPEVRCDGALACPTDGSLPKKVTMKLNVGSLTEKSDAGYVTVLTGDRRQG
jgi:prepilin-type N-terminal cleavage/methylation domain-containing protein